MAATVTQRLWAHGSVRFGVLVLGFMCLIALIAPLLGTVDPAAMDSNHINKAAGVSGDFALLDGSTVAHTFWFGTDSFGRDLYSRVMYGARVSLLVGLSTALLSLALGGLLGMMAGYFRAVDTVLMRVMDGLMAIPAILLAIALVAALGAGRAWALTTGLARAGSDATAAAAPSRKARLSRFIGGPPGSGTGDKGADLKRPGVPRLTIATSRFNP